MDYRAFFAEHGDKTLPELLGEGFTLDQIYEAFEARMFIAMKEKIKFRVNVSPDAEGVEALDEALDGLFNAMGGGRA